MKARVTARDHVFRPVLDVTIITFGPWIPAEGLVKGTRRAPSLPGSPCL